MKEMILAEEYQATKIFFINFTRWYAVFIPKKDGTSAMHHFSQLEDARQFIEKTNMEESD